MPRIARQIGADALAPRRVIIPMVKTRQATTQRHKRARIPMEKMLRRITSIRNRQGPDRIPMGKMRQRTTIIQSQKDLDRPGELQAWGRAPLRAQAPLEHLQDQA